MKLPQLNKEMDEKDTCAARFRVRRRQLCSSEGPIFSKEKKDVGDEDGMLPVAWNWKRGSEETPEVVFRAISVRAKTPF